MRLTVGKREHLAKNFATGFDEETYDILASLGFTNIGDLVSYVEAKNETDDKW